MPNFEPHMPEVDIVTNIDAVFSKARELATACDEKGRSPIAVTPSHQLLVPLGSVRPHSMRPEQVRPIEGFVPRSPQQRITVIALNTVETLADAGWNKSIPFAGFLVGLSYIGHSVVITEGHPSVLSAALKNTDLLIVDAGMSPFLQKDWVDVADSCGVQRILIFDRQGQIHQLNDFPSTKSDVAGSAVSSPETRRVAASPMPARKPWWKVW